MGNGRRPIIPTAWDSCLMTLGVPDRLDAEMTSRALLLPARRLCMAAVLVATVASCGTDGDSDASAADAAGTYCASVGDVEEYAGGLFADLGEAASIDDQLAAERQILDYIEAQGYDRQELPVEIAEDWQLFWEGWTTRLEPGNPQPTTEQVAAEERLLAWEAENCDA